MVWHVQGTILPGVTRRSVLELAASRGYTVDESPVSVTDALDADEVRSTERLSSTKCTYVNALHVTCCT